jgi:hypothetical protein
MCRPQRETLAPRQAGLYAISSPAACFCQSLPWGASVPVWAACWAMWEPYWQIIVGVI